MEKDKYDLEGTDGMHFKKGKFSAWLENFFYHYKWHTIVSLFLVITVIICSVQFCSRDKYDAYVLYAGSRDIRSIQNENDISEYSKVYKSLTEVVPDFDENGEKMPSLEALYMLSSEEIKKIEEELREQKENGEESYELNYSLLQTNNQTFRDRMLYGEFYVCLISKNLYESYKTLDGVQIFTPLAPYVHEGTEIEYLDDSAIYLHSTAFGALPGISDMPSDTVVVLRSISAISSHFDKKGNEENFKRSEQIVENIINYR